MVKRSDEDTWFREYCYDKFQRIKRKPEYIQVAEKYEFDPNGFESDNIIEDTKLAEKADSLKRKFGLNLLFDLSLEIPKERILAWAKTAKPEHILYVVNDFTPFFSQNNDNPSPYDPQKDKVLGSFFRDKMESVQEFKMDYDSEGNRIPNDEFLEPNKRYNFYDENGNRTSIFLEQDPWEPDRYNFNTDP